MKKVFSASILFLLLFCLLTGCGCKHEWAEATCDAPKTCALCGETEGEPLSHNWIDATCTAPKTCTLCAATEGEAPGHSWVDATCTAPKTCSVCAATDGAAAGHIRGEWVCNGEQFQYSCTVCGEETVQTPEAFFLELLTGQWKLLVMLTGTDREESITFHDDGTASPNLQASLVCPDTVRLEAGKLSYTESNCIWSMTFYLEDHLSPVNARLDADHGLYLLVTVREDRQEHGITAVLLHRGYGRSWILSK